MRPFLMVMALTAASARASAVDDVALGTDVRLTSVVLRVEGKAYALTDRLVSKPSGTLDLTVPLSAFGIAHGDSVRLTGSRSGSQLRWAFDHRLSSDYVMGTVHLQRVRGTLVLESTRIPGSTPCSGSSCARNVRLRVAPGTGVEAMGWNVVPFFGDFTRAVEVVTFSAAAGVPQPVLQSVSLDLPSSRCATSSWTVAPGVVTLALPAPSTGAVVAMRSTDPSAVWVSSARVRGGERSARFTVLIRSGFASTVQIVAVAGGVTRMALVDRVSCPSPAFPPTKARSLVLSGTPVGWLLDKRVVVHRTMGDVLVEPLNGKETPLASLVAGAPHPRVLAVKGRELVLRPSGNATEAWVVNLLGPRSEKLPLVTPLALAPSGVSLAVDAQGTLGVLDAPSGFHPSPTLAQVSVVNASANSAGDFAVGLVDGNSVVPAVVNFDQVIKLGTRRGEATAILESGQVFGHQLDAQQQPRAFSCDATCVAGAGKTLKVWPLPRGCTSATVTHAAESGWIAGVATCTGKALPWLGGPTGQVWRLDDLLVIPGADLREVVALSDDGELLLRAVSSQTNTYFWVTR
jgi:hypothetical protein